MNDDALDLFVLKSIELLRTKLLDLTTRNPLLKYVHTARGRRCIRIIDELPDQLFDRMVSGSTMKFKSLGEQPNEPKDEKSIEFRRAFDTAKLSDAEFLRQVGELGDEPGERQIESVESELKNRIRVQLGMTTARGGNRVSAEERARQLGLNPSYDLPSSAAQDSDKHINVWIQTLMFESDLLRMLGRIRQDVNLSVSESGVNPLFMVLGFLEWYESNDSHTPMHAPLMLLPIEIDRELKRGSYNYVIRVTGEKAMTNVTLLERLKRDFQLSLPQLDDDEEVTPEAHFADVQHAVRMHRNWRVRRWATLGMFHFARIAMYRDLDPNQWSEKGGLEKKPELRRLLGGLRDERANEDYSHRSQASAAVIDSEPPLIADADSSQLETISQVLAGRSIVVEGPPGTGKSQTITNLIAAAMDAGKSVLFVCEKMAALTVVRDRLTETGLGPYCLELHSTKGNRREVLNALALRRNIPKSLPVTTELRSTLVELDQLKHQLSDLIEGLKRPAARLAITAQQLLWRCSRIKDLTKNVPEEIDDLVLPNADEVDVILRDRITQACERFADSRQVLVGHYKNAAGNPWYGIAHAGIETLMAQQLVRKMAEMASAAGRVDQSAMALTKATGWEVIRIGDIASIADNPVVAEPDTSAPQALLSQIGSSDVRALVRQFLHDLKSYVCVAGELKCHFVEGRFAEPMTHEVLSEIVNVMEELGCQNVRCDEVASLAQKKHSESANWAEAQRLLGEIAGIINWPGPIELRHEGLLISAVRLAQRISTDLLPFRGACLTDPGASTSVAKAIELETSLRNRRSELASRYVLESAGTPAGLRDMAHQLRAAGFWGFLNSKVRQAEKWYRGISRNSNRLARSQMADGLESIALLLDDECKLAVDTRLRTLCGDLFAGIDSPWTEFQAVSSWSDAVRSAIPNNDDLSVSVRRFLLQGRSEEVSALAAMASQKLFEPLAKRIEAGTAHRTIQERYTDAQNEASLASRLESLTQRSGLVTDWNLGETKSLLQKLTMTRQQKDRLDCAHEVSRHIPDLFRGSNTDPGPLEAGLKFADSLSEQKTPQPLQNWLLTDNTAERCRQLRPLFANVAKAMVIFNQSIAALNEISPIRYGDWMGLDSPWQCNAAELAKHARSNADQPEALAQLIDDYRNLQDVHQLGIGPLVQLFEDRQVEWTHFPKAAQRLVYHSVLKRAISGCPALLSFQGDRFESFRKSFRELDHKLKRLRQQDIVYRQLQRKIDPGKSDGPVRERTGEALIALECGKQKKLLSIRSLMERAGLAIQQLMPCFMMSPLSVAQFLKPNGFTFDLLIMDEASQLRTEDAAGAIARARQVVIVGDPKQLPPTNFFMVSDSDSDDEDLSVESLSSVLDAATPQLPSHRLRWHYRSRHPSLIEFSNREFYSDKPLVLFPSPCNSSEEMGVKYVHVQDGLYRSRTNVPEARAIVEAAVEHARRFPERSLGIVALNLPQKELLDLELDRVATEQPDFGEWRQRREHLTESLFVKNLENVQGDERDTIFISTVFGRDENGAFYQRFGPINSDGGHRRLNVLFTRAKCQTVVFSSFAPEDIRTDHTSKLGVRALRGYLLFARDRKYESMIESVPEADSDFEIAVRQVLSSHGYDAVPQVGSAGFYIDLAVRHPNRPGEYVLGVECDGASYHSSSSARDRDRLRQEILERLGWRLHRIWSLDWFRHGTREKQRLLAAVEAAIKLSDSKEESIDNDLRKDAENTDVDANTLFQRANFPSNGFVDSE